MLRINPSTSASGATRYFDARVKYDRQKHEQ